MWTAVKQKKKKTKKKNEGTVCSGSDAAYLEMDHRGDGRHMRRNCENDSSF